jgi:hypothetical protein
MHSDLKIASLEPTRPDHLKIRRLRRGSGFAYVRTNGRQIREGTIIRRLERLAVPPAYRDTRFAISPRAHIQAVGRDAAGRLQYRYHPEWERIRELRKARRLLPLGRNPTEAGNHHFTLKLPSMHRNRIWEILERSSVGMLTTRFGGGLRARPLDARPDRKFGIIFFRHRRARTKR